MRAFRFGVQLSGPADAKGWVEQARKIEDLGYSTATMPDHFTDQLAPMPALAAAAAATTTLRVGALVFDNDYKHPVVLAKELATMDVLSAGRVEIGIGAGWMESDYRAAGMPYDRAGVRIDRFAEAIAVIKGSMADGDVLPHRRALHDHRLRRPAQAGAAAAPADPHRWRWAPRPVDRRAGGRHRRHQRQPGGSGVIGPEAVATMTREAVVERVAIVREAAGERIDDIELNIRAFFVSVTDDRAGTVSNVAGFIGVEEAMVEASPFALIGSTDAIADELVRRREELGFSYVIVGGGDIDAFAPVVAKLAGT